MKIKPNQTYEDIHRQTTLLDKFCVSHAFNLNFILQFVVGGLTGIRSAVFDVSDFYYEAARKTIFSHFIFLALFELHAVSKPLHTAILCSQLGGQNDVFTGLNNTRCLIDELLLELHCCI